MQNKMRNTVTLSSLLKSRHVLKDNLPLLGNVSFVVCGVFNNEVADVFNV